MMACWAASEAGTCGAANDAQGGRITYYIASACTVIGRRFCNHELKYCVPIAQLVSAVCLSRASLHSDSGHQISSNGRPRCSHVIFRGRVSYHERFKVAACLEDDAGFWGRTRVLA